MDGAASESPDVQETSVEDRVRAVVAEELGMEKEEIDGDSAFVDDLGADSLDVVELTIAFEEEFGCEIPDEDAEKMGTVKKMIEYIEKRVH